MLIVAALSARQLAEAAARDGFDAVALDLFGDVDTRRAACRWARIGSAGSMRIDAKCLLDALRAWADCCDVRGWVIGSGFEGCPELLAEGAAIVPLLGTRPADAARVRDPALFFDVLDRHSIAHPAVTFDAPRDGTGWLLKNAHGCGGWHIRAAAAHAPPASGAHYFQRAAPGMAMSATFIANGADAVVLGFNRLLARRVGARPYVYGGAIGPLALPQAAAAQALHALRVLTTHFELRGLGSLDFLFDDGRVDVLEVNPRAPASMALYAQQPLMRAHVRACLEGTLPEVAGPPAGAPVHGVLTVFAPRTLQIDAARAERIACFAGAHDLPDPHAPSGTMIAADDPICSLSAQGADADHVEAALDARAAALLAGLTAAPLVAHRTRQ